MSKWKVPDPRGGGRRRPAPTSCCHTHPPWTPGRDPHGGCLNLEADLAEGGSLFWVRYWAVRILSRSEFLTQPPGTPYYKLPAGYLSPVGSLCVKLDTADWGPGVTPNDWMYVDFDTPEFDDTDELSDRMDAMRADSTVSFPLGCPDDGRRTVCRDGCFEDPSQVSFLVFEPDDIRVLLRYLTPALVTAGLAALIPAPPSDEGQPSIG